MNQTNSDNSDPQIDMEPDNWRQIYLYGRDLVVCLFAVAVCAAAAGYLTAKFY